MTAALAFDAQGSGDTAVLLLHGVGGGRRIWGESGSRSLRALADAGYRALAVDLPGYGESLPCTPFTMAAMAQSVLALIGTLGARHTVLVGHSMGGMVAQELVAAAPQAMAGLVLACTSAAFGKADGAWQAAFLRERVALLDAGQGMAALADALVPGMLAPGASAQALQQGVAIMSRVSEATYRAALAAIVGFDRRADLARIAVPTLCLAGEHDRTAPADMVQRMAGRITGAAYHCIAGAGHLANVEQPVAFNATVVSFMQQHFVNQEPP